MRLSEHAVMITAAATAMVRSMTIASSTIPPAIAPSSQ